MMAAQDAPVELCIVARELDAPWIVDYLAAHGIKAMALALGPTGFGGPSGGQQRIVVRAGDLELAQALLRQREAEMKEFNPAEIDWSNVDTGDTSPLREDEINPPLPPPPPVPIFICRSCGYQTKTAGNEGFCLRCGVRSPLAEYTPATPADRVASWLFAALLVIIALALFTVLFL